MSFLIRDCQQSTLNGFILVYAYIIVTYKHAYLKVQHGRKGDDEEPTCEEMLQSRRF